MALAAATLASLTVSGCMIEPPAPLWDLPPFSTVAVLPARAVVSTGAPPFTSPDTDRSNRVGEAMQMAAAAALVQKGYDVLPPLDVNEKLSADRALGERFMSLAAGFGMVPDANLPPDAMDRGLSEAGPIAQALGADLLVLVRGSGEYHSLGEALIQQGAHALWGVITKGRESYNAPTSSLSADIFFVDPAQGRRVAILTAGMSYSEDAAILARTLLRRMARVPDGPKARPTSK